MSDKVPIVLIWADGRREVIFGVIASRVAYAQRQGSGFVRVMFDREVVCYPDNYHGPFQSFHYNADDGFPLGETREIRYRETAESA